MQDYFYKHFDNDVPESIEKEYNRLLLHEQYLEKREQRFREQTAEFENVVSTCPDPETMVISDYAIEQKKLHDARIDYLPVALKLLKEQYPNLHCLIIEYFCTDKKVTMIELSRRHGLTVETVRYRIKSAKEKLKGYIILHETGM